MRRVHHQAHRHPHAGGGHRRVSRAGPALTVERPSVLVVDDRDIDRKLVDRALGAAGYDVTTAASGEEAIELVRSRLFDAAVVDLRMPGMNGIELLRLVKEHSPAV